MTEPQPARPRPAGPEPAGPEPAEPPPDQSQPPVLVERAGHVLIVTLNRPHVRNALTTEMMELLANTWDEVNADPDIRVAILTGAGGAFCAGADLKQMSARPPGEAFKGDGDGTTLALDMSVMKWLMKGFTLTKPLVAAVEGPAIAGGTEILQATDIRVAGESARFGVSEVRWGLFPLGGSAVRLRRQVPYAVAADILLTGRHLDAAEAKEIGLVNYVVPDGTALAKATQIAEAIAANGPVAVQAVLRTLRETESLPEEEAFKIESEIGMRVFLSDDARIGPRAFAQKQTPTFTGR
ncbi:crotonase/enoyl-CoA hydratase family protein [Frankia sp. CNm7]|uniref:Enoyl-CoA hydratase EchA19 n=1 Tax=Frankia nepalensis TaxID=1836974 RepID=A0A937UL56_9ACTN|nr:crotonase/enoyl-CoA hydratase family protein [Frankia nepalensis]MBL7496506.1 crotonase/enoyl-CoA hydratase family protein [Frankia nepalensis]MBL7511351.1 crotonase/enoyl-CoA hydratase family protein [Frankia nepalensis]MBL7521145.1 crotonase/enoyl-CoA hydratase family protein [Frankia nepalensis]MBL7627479.1 crotonase/enoyl-CoA hydratase family protein [Frankia nepalensis]